MRAIVQTLRRQSIAVVALCVALGGTSYAAIQLPANSVGAKQLKTASVTPGKIAPSTIETLKGEAAQKLTLRSSSSGSSSDEAEASIACPEGERAVGGGAEVSQADGGTAVVSENRPAGEFGSTSAAWIAKAKNIAGAGSVEATAYVICAAP